MGVMKDLKTRQNQNGSKQNSGQQNYQNMLTFHPTTEEREILKNTPVDTEKDLEYLSTFLVRGCTLSLGMRLDTGSCYATIRQKTDNWMTAPSVSAWHGEVCKAVKALAFVMRDRLDDFPETATKLNRFNDDW